MDCFLFSKVGLWKIWEEFLIEMNTLRRFVPWNEVVAQSELEDPRTPTWTFQKHLGIFIYKVQLTQELKQKNKITIDFDIASLLAFKWDGKWCGLSLQNNLFEKGTFSYWKFC